MANRNSRGDQRMSPEEQLKFNGWLKTNGVLGSILAIGILAMGFGGSQFSGTTQWGDAILKCYSVVEVT